MHVRLLLVAGALATSMSTTAFAQPNPPPGWTPAPQGSFTLPAGALCSFELQADDLEDQVVTRIVRSWPDGSPRTQLYAGALRYRFTNTASGQSVVRNVGGDALVEWGEDGSARWTYAGPVAVAFPPGGPLAVGLYVLDGAFVVDYAADGTQTLPLHAGSEENLCHTLAH